MSNAEKLSVLKSALGRCQSIGSEHVFLCPVKGCSDGRDSVKRAAAPNKFSINLEKGVAKCWVCGWKTRHLSRVVKIFGSHEDFERWLQIEGTASRKEDFLELLRGGDVRQKAAMNLPEGFSSVLTDRSYMAKLVVDYLRRRHFSEEDLWRWKPGYTMTGEWSGMVIFPSFNIFGELDFFNGRSVHEDFCPHRKVKAEQNIIFNELFVSWNEPITLCEGVFDAVVAGNNSIPLLGTIAPEVLYQRVEKFRPDVYVALDPDADSKLSDIHGRLLQAGSRVFSIDVRPYEDLSKMGKTEYARRKAQAEEITLDRVFLDNVRKRLSG